ncbi:MAG: MGMT family protein [Cyclobacteriaceae bacterium]|nr:MGMT family protein [Cyclobacteriaceae bacterium]
MQNRDNYFDLVYQVVRLIPKGRVTSYGAIANYLGLKSGARMVGYAMNASHSQADIPAHRVVNRNGVLTGKHHFPHPEFMQQQLELEGIEVKNDKILDFEKHFWNPNELNN